jgi:hypothetical protein
LFIQVGRDQPRIGWMQAKLAGLDRRLDYFSRFCRWHWLHREANVETAKQFQNTPQLRIRFASKAFVERDPMQSTLPRESLNILCS